MGRATFTSDATLDGLPLVGRAIVTTAVISRLARDAAEDAMPIGGG